MGGGVVRRRKKEELGGGGGRRWFYLALGTSRSHKHTHITAYNTQAQTLITHKLIYVHLCTQTKTKSKLNKTKHAK